MNLMLDTINLEKIIKYMEIVNVTGVTSNPSIVKKENCTDFYEHMNKIRQLIGSDRSLHIQVVATDSVTQLKEAQEILKRIDADVFIKVPVTEEGLKTIKILKSRNVNVTATAIYSEFQAYLAIMAGADYIAPYFNRMITQNIDSSLAIERMATMIKQSSAKCDILGASFKNTVQINDTYNAGASTVTVDPDLIYEGLNLVSVSSAVDKFAEDWSAVYGKKNLL